MRSDSALIIHLSLKFLELLILILYLLQTLHLSTLTIFLPLDITVSHSSHVTVLNSLPRSGFHFLNVSTWMYHGFLVSSVVVPSFVLSRCLFIIINARLLPPDVIIFDRLPLLFVQITARYFECCKACNAGAESIEIPAPNMSGTYSHIFSLHATGPQQFSAPHVELLKLLCSIWNH